MTMKVTSECADRERIGDEPQNETTVTGNFADKARAAFAEFLGMALFVWVGCGTAVSSQSILALNPESEQHNAFLASVSLAFGLAITVLIYTIAPLSGGHLNPAVTLAFVIIGEVDIVTGLRYMLSQCLGSVFGAGLVWGTMASTVIEEFSGRGEKGVPPFFLGSNFVVDSLPVSSAFLGEAVGTFLLVMTVIRTVVCKDSVAGGLAPIAVGSSVTLAHFVLVPITGCGINPARSFGPHLLVSFSVEKAADNWWVFYTAPFVGAIVAVFLCHFLRQSSFDSNNDKEIDLDVATCTQNKTPCEEKKGDHNPKLDKKKTLQCLDRKGSDSPL